VRIAIGIENGAELAGKTFNPRLGITGGLSILGTSGRVRPYSNKALRDALLCSLDVAEACGLRNIVLVPGNIGRRSAEGIRGIEPQQIIETSNEWGTMLEALRFHAFESALLLGHPGKLYKCAMGYWDTHSNASPMAVDAIIKRAADEGITLIEKAPTVEGIVSGLPRADRILLGNLLAADILAAVHRRFSQTIRFSVMLITMNGKVFGEAGEMGPWRI
jgi:cobalt-precorrin-5B (C1)-methyltransferase